MKMRMTSQCIHLASSFLIIAVLSGCASTHKRDSSDASRNALDPARATSSANYEDGDAPQEAEESTQKGPTVSRLTLDSNEKVDAWIRYFTVTDRERFQRFLNRGQKYRKIVQDVLVENDLPSELYFLALIESGYQNHATSSAQAVGVWQFMPATARRYGLQVNRYVDERRDPIRATEAAARYLRDLYNIFGSWPLAMAGYNAGEYRIIRTILKGKSRDYWTLVSLNILPKETADYVAKLIAAATIGADPEKYGFTDDTEESYPELEAVEVPSPVRLTDLAQRSDLSVERLREFNPHLRQDRTPHHVPRYEVWFPKENAAKVQSQLAQLAKLTPSKGSSVGRQVAVVKAPSTRANYHRVTSGENLTLIAQRYGVSVNFLFKVNSMRSSQHVYPGMELRLTSRAYHPQNVIRYRVKKGESLDRIAKRFGLTVKKLKDDNSLERNRIYPRQVLLIRRGDT